MLDADAKDFIKEFINECEKVIQDKDVTQAHKLQGKIISTLEIYIPGLTDGLDNYSHMTQANGSIVDWLGDIEKLKVKLRAYLLMPQDKDHDGLVSIHTENNNANTNTITNDINVNIDLKKMIDAAKEEIENNNSLSSAEVQEMIERLDEIQGIVNDDSSKRGRWDKCKGILSWVAEKGVNIGIQFLPIIYKAMTTGN